MAKANPFRFSTKYQDDETDLLYYGYRYYNASMGRWLSRDPIGIRGGLNLYACNRNDCLSKVDPLGLVIGAFGPQTISENDPSINNFSTDFSLTLSHVCGGSPEPKGGVQGQNCAYLHFFFSIRVTTKLPPPEAPRWSSPALFFADQELNAAWHDNPEYSARRQAVLHHEDKHINDMKASYDRNKDLLEGYECWYNSRELCNRIAQMIESRVRESIKADGEATDKRWD